MHLKINTELQGGKYRIIRFINSGGFGCTYEAHHKLMDSRVAIKEFFSKSHCSRDPHSGNVIVPMENNTGTVAKLKKKFLEEAKAVFKMQHPGIVRVTDVFEENGTAYYVMDYIEGMSLKEIIEQNDPLPEYKAINYITQVACALKYVHSLNRLHLDIKPGNIMLNEKGKAILIDFGTSKHYDAITGEHTTTIIGLNTPGYAPVEQSSQTFKTFNPATDIYALGATLYKLLSGITPISANELASGMALYPLPSNVSKSVKKAVESAMQTNIHNRPQSVDEFMAILTQANNSDDDETEYDEVTQLPEPAQAHSNKTTSKTASPEKKPIALYALLGISIVIAIVAVALLLNNNIDKNGSNKITTESTSAIDTPANNSSEEVTSYTNPRGYKTDIPIGCTKELSGEDLLGMSRYELKIMRNAIYAYRGYIFKDDDLYRHFIQYEWYRPKYTLDQVKNHLTKRDIKNIETISNYEQYGIPQ